MTYKNIYPVVWSITIEKSFIIIVLSKYTSEKLMTALFFFFFLNTGFSLLYMTKFFIYENSSQSMMFYLVWQILLFYYSLDGVNYSNMLTISCLPSQFLFLLCLPSYSLKAKVDCAEDIQQPNIPFPSFTIFAIAISLLVIDENRYIWERSNTMVIQVFTY